MAALTRVLRSAPTAGSTRISLSTLASERKTGLPAGLAARLVPTPARKGREERNVQWVFLGCPGVGKGTYASRLSQLLGVPHIATGDLVREELAASGRLSQKVIVKGGVFEGFVGISYVFSGNHVEF
jgi:adenylate kinase